MKRLAVGLLLVAAAGCKCGNALGKRAPVLVLDTERVDFGTVQVNLTHRATVTVLNDGTAPLTVTAFGGIATPFGVQTAPFTIDTGAKQSVVVTYAPTVANQIDDSVLVLSSNDPAQPNVSINLTGQGIQAVAVPQPATLDFGDVYAGETKTVTVTLTNQGSAALHVLDAGFTSAAPASPVLSGDLSPLVATIPASGSVSTSVTFAPQVMMNLGGALVLNLDPTQSPDLTLPLSGRGVRAIPRLCFQIDDAGETCTAADAGGGIGTSWDVPFPPLCDNRLFPPDSGPYACTGVGGSNPGQLSGWLTLRNEGNVAVQFTLQYSSNTSTDLDPCDAGGPPPADFELSNDPGDGGFTWTTGLLSVPTAPTDPTPWQMEPVRVTYHPTSRCPADSADQARVLFTRQNDSREPQILLGTLDGQSKLPLALPTRTSCGTPSSPQAVPCVAPFFGTTNAGPQGFQVQQVTLYEVVVADGGDPCAAGPDGGLFQPCSANPSPQSHCGRFAWADGGDPNAAAPWNIPAAPSPQSQGMQQVGTVVFGPDGGVGCTGGTCQFCVWAVVQTTDPYHPQVISEISGTAP